MQEGKIYRLHTGFTHSLITQEDGWLWLCIGPLDRNGYARFKSIATGVERGWPARYFIHHTED